MSQPGLHSSAVRSLLLLATLALAGSAHADELTVAREHYRRGTTLYDLRRYHEAAKEYEAAYELKDDPTLLFNIGQAYRFAGEYEDAVGAYKSFLRRLPRAPNRVDVEQRIAEMLHLQEERHKDEQHPPHGTLPTGVESAPAERAPAPAPPTTAPPLPQQSATTPPERPQPTAVDPRPSRTLKRAGIGIAAGGVVLAVVGGALVGVAGSAGDHITHLAPASVFDPSVERRALTEQNAGIALLVVGGAAAVTGAVVAILGRHRERPAVSLAPVVSRNYAGAFLGADF